MELGERLRQARLEAGLSQRALCGDTITRNMLSQIEHGTARPSLETLQILAKRLGKPVGYLLQEELPALPNGDRVKKARAFFDAGDYGRAVEALEDFVWPDGIWGREGSLLLALARLNWAEALLAADRAPYAAQILENTVTAGIYCGEYLEERRLSLLARVKPVTIPSLDEGLLLRAELALKAGDPKRAGALLDAAEDRNDSRFALLRGLAYLGEGDYAQALRHLKNAEEAYPKETVPALETCCEKLGDYRQAYEYACKRRK